MNNKPNIKRVWGAWVCEDFHVPYTGRRAVGLTPASAYENWKLVKQNSVNILTTKNNTAILFC